LEGEGEKRGGGDEVIEFRVFFPKTRLFFLEEPNPNQIPSSI
jgi:hypothetical protein